MEAERKGAEAHLKSCEAEQLLSQATDLTQSAATSRSKETEVRHSHSSMLLLHVISQLVLHMHSPQYCYNTFIQKVRHCAAF